MAGRKRNGGAALIMAAAMVLGMAACADQTEEISSKSDAEPGSETVESGSGAEPGSGTMESGSGAEPGSGAETGGVSENGSADKDSLEEGSLPEEDKETEKQDMENIELVQIPEWPQAQIPENDALAFVESMQLGWNLGNTFDAVNCNVSDELQYESAWSGAVTTKEMIQELGAAGFRTIRIPISWHNHVDEDYRISEAWMNRVREVVDWAFEEDMYVIINIHHDNEKGFLYPSYEHLEQSKEYVTAIWEQIAECFEDYDERLLFETLNEPRQTGTDHEWWVDVNSETGKECLDAVNQLNQAAVDAIRGNGKGYNSTRYIMAPGYCASPDFALAEGYVLPTDSGGAENRILVSVHAYTPYNFALAAPGDSDSTDRFSVAEKKGTEDIDAFMGKLYDKFISKGTGVVIGEFGARIKNDNTSDRKEFAAYYIARARHYGITACWWDNNAFTGGGENFGLFRRTDNEFSFPEILEQMVYYSKTKQE